MLCKLIFFIPLKIVELLLFSKWTCLGIIAYLVARLIYFCYQTKPSLKTLFNLAKVEILKLGRLLKAVWKHILEIGWKGNLSVGIALLSLTVGNLFFQLIYKLPFVNLARKRFQKESQPFLRFRTWRSWLVMGLVGSLGALMLTSWLVCLLRGVIPLIYNLGKVSFDIRSLLLSNLFKFDMFNQAPILAWPIFLVLEVVVWKSAWINWEQYRDYNHNESGDDRFAKLSELKRQYKRIPDKAKTYPGHSGVPVIHVNKNNLPGWALNSQMKFRARWFSKWFLWSEYILGLNKVPAGYYYLEDDTINALITGMTRSGKGEGLVNPAIDIASRAEEKSSLILGDAKGELYQASYKILRKRGYNVQVLSYMDMDWSMSYNPLALAIDAAKHGYYEKTQAYVNSVAEAIYRKSLGKGAGNEKYWEDTSIALFNAITMALIDRANETSQKATNPEIDAWDTITIRNVAKFLNDLGSDSVIDLEKSTRNRIVMKSKLTDYFDELRQVNVIRFSKFREMADINFRASDFASEETKGNVYSSMMSGLNLFLQDNIARLTSKNSLDLRSIGNPRRLSIRFKSSSINNQANRYAHKPALISFYSEVNGPKQGKGRLGGGRLRSARKKYFVKESKVLLDGRGYLNFNLQPQLPKRFYLEIELDGQTYKWVGNKIYQGTDEYTGEAILTGINLREITEPTSEPRALVDPAEIEFVYGEKPIALFMVTPPDKPEYYDLVSLMIDQIFNANYELALASDSRKTTVRVQFILDEFANIPKIPNMATKLSIGLGQNICFMMFVQNLEQIEDKYGKENTASIIGNCSLNILIKSTSAKTAEAYSKALGVKTITKREKGTNILNEANPHINTRNPEQRLLTANQLSKLESGEAVIIRGVKAQDKAGRKVTPDPIFVHGKTELPYRYMFLADEFDQSTTVGDIPIESKHRDLDLNDVAVKADNAWKKMRDWHNRLEKANDCELAGRHDKVAW